MPRWLVIALFVVGVNFFSSWSFPSGSGGDIQLRRSRSGGQLLTSLQFVLDGGSRGHRHDERCQLRRSVFSRESHTMSVYSAPVFDAQPTSSDVHNRLSISFVAPVSHCSVCDVDEAFSDGASYTLFEACGRETCFHEVRRRRTRERRQVLLEFEALLEHLFRHIHTSVHVAKRVIRHFVTSNLLRPTSDLLWLPADVTHTTVYQGGYGNLGAIVASILLFPEARSSDYCDTLREHIVTNL